jgi:hypothetical protein
MVRTVIHLHWSKNPKLVCETSLGITMCGIKVPREELTAFVTDTTCKACLAREAEIERGGVGGRCCGSTVPA